MEKVKKIEAGFLTGENSIGILNVKDCYGNGIIGCGTKEALRVLVEVALAELGEEDGEDDVLRN